MDQFRSPETYDWHYGEVCFKASHNSYARDEKPVTSQSPWLKDTPSDRGCRGLEIDIHQSECNAVWSVSHDGPYSGSVDQQLSEYLIQLKDFSRRHDSHDVITVMLDIKDVAPDLAAFPEDLDTHIERYLGRERLYVPAELQKNANSLVEGAMINTWPILGQLTGRFIFCLTGDETTKGHYADSGKDRLCFSDLELYDPIEIPSLKSGSRVFFNFDFDGAIDWTATVRMFAARRGFVTRGYDINVDTLWNRARSAGVNIIATDKVCNHEWARVGDAPFVRVGDQVVA
jgi:hypothetical protein